MSLLTTMARGARAAVGTPTRNINDPSTDIYRALTDDGFGGYLTASGRTVSPRTATRLIPVYSATSFIASSIAALPIRIVRRGDETREEVRSPRWHAINVRPNPYDTLMEHEEMVILSLLLHGNAYEPIFRGPGGIQERYVLNPDRVEPMRVHGTREVVYVVEGLDVAAPARDILHTPALRRPGRLEGMSPIGEAREALGTALAAEELAGRRMGGGTFLDGYIQTEQTLPAGKAAALVRRWRQMQAGVSNAWRTPLLDSGAKYETVGMPLKDAQFLESRKYHATQVASLYRVAPHLIADVERSTSWGSGIAEQDTATLKYTLMPWMVRREQRLEMLLPPDLSVRHVTAALLRGTLKARYESYARGVDGGWLSPNDVRRMEDMPPRDGGDAYRDVSQSGGGMMGFGEGGEGGDGEGGEGRSPEQRAAALVAAGFDETAAASLNGLGH